MHWVIQHRETDIKNIVASFAPVHRTARCDVQIVDRDRATLNTPLLWSSYQGRIDRFVTIELPVVIERI